MYAASTASKVAYSTYIYTQVPVAKFQIVTAYTKAALLAGRCIAGILGQILVATGTCDYLTLNYISLGFVSISTVFACLLPSVSRSIYFHRGKAPAEGSTSNELVQLETSKVLHHHQDCDEVHTEMVFMVGFCNLRILSGRQLHSATVGSIRTGFGKCVQWWRRGFTRTIR
jgi:hypothetical protein